MRAGDSKELAELGGGDVHRGPCGEAHQDRFGNEIDEKAQPDPVRNKGDDPDEDRGGSGQSNVMVRRGDGERA